MIGLNFKDVFVEGNKAGFAIGGVPSVSATTRLGNWQHAHRPGNGISSKSPTTSASPLVCSGFPVKSWTTAVLATTAARLATAVPMFGAASSRPSSSSDLSPGEGDPSPTPLLFSHTKHQPLPKEGLFYCSKQVLFMMLGLFQPAVVCL